jgi:hypothetical protein
MTSEDLRYCAGQGILIGMQHWLPTQPFDYDWGREHPWIGCNHLRCSGCRESVTATQQNEYSRRYKCRCSEYSASEVTSLSQDDGYHGLSALDNPPPPTWACAGHPALSVPTELDGVRVSPDSFVDIARAGFASPPFIPPGTVGHSIWVSRLYWVLPQSLRVSLAKAVMTLIQDHDPVIVVRALRFFTEQDVAPGHEGLAIIARDHGARLAKIPDPDHPRFTAENELLTAIGRRAFRRDDAGQLTDPIAHEVMRRAVLAGKNPDDILYSFGRLELDWLAAHALEIVTSNPSELLDPVMWMLKKLPADARDKAYRRIANVDPKMRAHLQQLIAREFNGEERDRILAHLEA